MGLFEKILAPRHGRRIVGRAFSTFTDYSPVFSTYSGGMYELAMTRSAIHAFATGCSKLKPEVLGNARPRIRRAIETSPNDFQTWPQFLYRTATILECDTTCAIVPEYGEDGVTMTGLWPLKFSTADIVEYAGEPYVRFNFPNGETASIELSEVCFITKSQYESDFFGSPNVLQDTMELIDYQRQAQKNAIKNGSSVRFIGQVAGQVREQDLEKKRKAFSAENLSSKNDSGIVLYDQTFTSVEQIKPYSYTISDGEMARIEKSVNTYFGINEEILTNHFNEDAWNAYYEGRIEPFAIQLGEGLSHMLYTQRERINNRVMFSSNRLEYATSASKRNMIRDMLDRGVFCIDDAREILQMPPLPDGEGQVRVIRGEYIAATMLNKYPADEDKPGIDMTKKDSDKYDTADIDNSL